MTEPLSQTVGMATNSQTLDDIILRAAAWHVAKEEVQEKADALVAAMFNVLKTARSSRWRCALPRSL